MTSEIIIYPALVMGWEEPERSCYFVNNEDELYNVLNHMIGECIEDGFDYNKKLIEDAKKHFENEGPEFQTGLGECAHISIIAQCYHETFKQTEPEEEK